MYSLLQSVRSAGKDFSRFASTIKSSNGAVHFVGTVPLFFILYIFVTSHYLIFGLQKMPLLIKSFSCVTDFSSFCASAGDASSLVLLCS